MDENKKSNIKEIISYVLIIVVTLLIKEFVFTLIIVNGNSMDPTLNDDDIMVLNKFSYHFEEIERFDIVVCEDEEGYLIKRVIGLPGEILYYKDNKLYINGKEVEENFDHGITADFGEVLVKEGEYFVMGDNREDSLDSRKLGTFSRSNILGRTSYVLYPFSRFGSKN